MPVAALLAPEIAALIAPEAVAAGGLAATGLEAGLGAGLGAGSGALFGEITGQGPGPGALAGGIGGAAGPIGGALGEAAGIGSTAGAAIGGGLGGFGGAELTGGNPLIGAAAGAATPLIGAAITPSATPAAPGTSVTSSGPASSPTSAASLGGSPGAQTAAVSAPPPVTATGGISGGSTGGAAVDGTGAMGLSDPNAFLLPTGTTQTAGAAGPGYTFDPTGYTALPGTDAGTIGTSGGDFLGNFGTKLGNMFSDPRTLLAAAPLLVNLLNQQGPYPAENALTGQATGLGTAGQALQSYVQSGTLPPGAQANADAAANAAKAQDRSAYARLGLSDSSMLPEALGVVDQQKAGQEFLLADQLLGQGLNASNAASSAYQPVLRAEITRDTQFQQALANFARGLGGFVPGTNTQTNYQAV